MKCSKCPFGLVCLRNGKPPHYKSQCYSCNRTVVQARVAWEKLSNALLGWAIRKSKAATVRIQEKKSKTTRIVHLSDFYYVFACEPVMDKVDLSERVTGRHVQWEKNPQRFSAPREGNTSVLDFYKCPICHDPRYVGQNFSRLLTQHRVLVIDIDEHPEALHEDPSTHIYTNAHYR